MFVDLHDFKESKRISLLKISYTMIMYCMYVPKYATALFTRNVYKSQPYP